MGGIIRSSISGFGLLLVIQSCAHSIVEKKTLEEYQAQSAVKKQSELWSKILETKYWANFIHQALSTASKEQRKNLEKTEYLKISFTHHSDEFPPGRIRLIHATGGVAKISLVRTEESKHTGLFQTGARGLVRLSLAAPQIANTLGLAPFIPGMGLKLFIDGKESVNLMTMNSLDGQESKNIFSATFTNDLPTPKVEESTKKMFEAFKQTVEELSPGSNPLFLNLAHWARINSDGSEVKNPVAPHSIVLVPTAMAQESYSCCSSFPKDFRGRLANVDAGTIIYTIYTKATKVGPLVLWGNIITDSEFVASQYGDQSLFFRHHLE